MFLVVKGRLGGRVGGRGFGILGLEGGFVRFLFFFFSELTGFG